MDTQKHWGKSVAINLYECDHGLLVDAKILKVFIKQLVQEIGMVAHGPCRVDTFGSGSLHGISAMQFIETSSITVHLDDKGNRAFIDIFSCKDFDHLRARDFAKQYYKAKKAKTQMMWR